MAHRIEKGIDRVVATIIRSIWHHGETAPDGRLVEIESDGDEESTMLRSSGIVWPEGHENDAAELEEVRTIRGAAVPDHVATVTRSGRVLGIVSKDYALLPFKSIATNLLLALARAGGKLSSMGTFNGGASFFASLLVADAWRVPGDNHETTPFLNLTSNHQGKGGLRMSFQAFRAICGNTSDLSAAIHDKMMEAESAAERVARAWVTISHVGDPSERMRAAAQYISDGRARTEQYRELMAALAVKQVDRVQLQQFIDQYISIPRDASDRTKGIREAERSKFRAVMLGGDLGEHSLTGRGITAYGLFESVTHFEDYVSRAQDSADAPVGTRRAFRAFLGTKETEKQAALDVIRELVAV